MAKEVNKPKKEAGQPANTAGRLIKKPRTLRERAEKASEDRKPRRINMAGSTAVKPLKAVVRTGRKEFYLPLPDNKTGRFLNKKRRVIPGYFRGAWQELRQVKWPTNRETIRLTLAVFVFAIFFMSIITAADYGLDKLFKKLILK